MPRISRSSLLISVATMIVVVAAACDSPASKPIAEPDPPTPIPTVTAEAESLAEDSTANINPGRQDIADVEAQECLAGELGFDIDPTTGLFDRGLLREVDAADLAAVFVKCDVAQVDRAAPFGGRRGQGGGFAGGAFADPEVQECLTAELGEDFASSTGGIFGGLTGGGLSEELTAAFKECGIDFSGGFGGGGRGGFGGDGSFQECLTEALGEDALLQLRNPEGPPSDELQEALQECGNAIVIPVEPGSGSGDGAGPVPGEPAAEPEATPVPVSDLTVEQLTCLSSELEPADLVRVVVATNSGDLSTLSEAVLPALTKCDVGS
jgi:hypothetical protein